MKFFYTKKEFQRVLEEKKNIKEDFDKYKEENFLIINKLQDECFKHLEEKSNIENRFLKVQKHINALDEEINSLKIENASIKNELVKEKNRNGGFKKANIDYKNKNKELKKRIKELEEEKKKHWFLKKLPNTKVPTQKIKHIQDMSSNVREFMKEKYDYKENK